MPSSPFAARCDAPCGSTARHLIGSQSSNVLRIRPCCLRSVAVRISPLAGSSWRYTCKPLTSAPSATIANGTHGCPRTGSVSLKPWHNAMMPTIAAIDTAFGSFKCCSEGGCYPSLLWLLAVDAEWRAKNYHRLVCVNFWLLLHASACYVGIETCSQVP